MWCPSSPCRWEAVQLSLGGLRQKVCPLRRAFPPPPNAHGREKVCLQRVWPALHAQRPLDQTRSAAHDHQEVVFVARRNPRAQQSGPAQGPKQRPRASYWHAGPHSQLRLHHEPTGPTQDPGGGEPQTRHVQVKLWLGSISSTSGGSFLQTHSAGKQWSRHWAPATFTWRTGSLTLGHLRWPTYSHIHLVTVAWSRQHAALVSVWWRSGAESHSSAPLRPKRSLHSRRLNCRRDLKTGSTKFVLQEEF